MRREPGHRGICWLSPAALAVGLIAVGCGGPQRRPEGPPPEYEPRPTLPWPPEEPTSEPREIPPEPESAPPADAGFEPPPELDAGAAADKFE